MHRVVNTEKIPILLWLDQLDEEAMDQARHLANLDCAFHHVAIMADAHVGYGMPIGGVLATVGAVIPNGVGVDIGCGMQAVRTGLDEVGLEQLRAILGDLRRTAPGSAGTTTVRSPSYDARPGAAGKEHELPVIRAEFASARRQLGTLGGGNHFIEIQQGSDNHIWLMVHSGRNLGYKVAGLYNRLAVQLHEEGGPGHDPEGMAAGRTAARLHRGAALPRKMTYCVAFARAIPRPDDGGAQRNRRRGDRLHSFTSAATRGPQLRRPGAPFRREVWVHRKGATRAFAGESGIIPGPRAAAATSSAAWATNSRSGPARTAPAGCSAARRRGY